MYIIVSAPGDGNAFVIIIKGREYNGEEIKGYNLLLFSQVDYCFKNGV